MQRPIFFNNQSGEDVLRAMRAAKRREAAVVLSRTLVQEIREITGIAGPCEPTVFLLRVEHRRKVRPVRRFGRRATELFARAVPLAIATALAAALGCALVGG